MFRLRRSVHKHRCDKKLIILPDGLHPAYIGTVEHCDTNLCRTPNCLECSDHNAEYLVDEENDPEHEKSRWYGRDGKTIISGDLCSECLRLKVRRN